MTENSVALVQAFLNLPPAYIGGVSLDERREFLSLVSHYGDIDFANGYFRLGGDGARAYDKPEASWFQVKIIPRKEKRPICLVAQYHSRENPISVISFGPYWRWTDMTEQYLPDGLELDGTLMFRFSREHDQVTVIDNRKYTVDGREYFKAGSMRGVLQFEEGRFFYTKFDYAEFFQDAIRELPPKYMADIPLEQREQLLETIRNDPERFDLENGWLHWFSDGNDVAATSMFWLKLLPRASGAPYVFVHMAKPFAGGQAPRENQTFVLQRENGKWEENTKILSPDKYNLEDHFRPRRDGIIELGSWKKIEAGDGKGSVWGFGEREFDLKWRDRFLYGGGFARTDSESTVFSTNQ